MAIIYYMGVIIDSSNTYESFLIKMDTSGNEVWRLTYPDYGWFMTETADGGYLWKAARATLIKINNKGEVIWEHSFAGENTYGIGSVAEASDGGFLFFGTTGGHQIGPAVYQGCNIWLNRIDSNGNKIWSREFDLGGNEWGGHVFQNSEGEFVLIGTIEGYSFPTSYGYPYRPETIYLIKVNDDGNMME